MVTPPPRHRRLRLDLAYCGTPWRGWQSQPDGSAVQDQLHAALQRLTKGPELTIEGASRTDAGVHALGQVAHLDLPERIRLQPEALRNGWNGLLPETIRVLAIKPAPPGFHATLSATAKVYRYRIQRSREMDPFEADRAWHVHGSLDLDALRKALQCLEGTHNFVRFSANPGAVPEEERRTDVAGHTRTLHRADFRESDSTLEIELEGDAFLYHMVRLIVGALLQVARRRAPVDWFAEFLSNPDGPQNQVMAPGGGLYLARVRYDPMASSAVTT